MRIIHGLVLGFFLVVSLSACAVTSDKERPKVICPACGAELDAVIHKQF